ncbi:MAG TPA: 5'/3'-nucleotidase SurE [Candidatus Nitrosotalea sp.]|nr:5'/3'-nucleotidase SurE [Candidatus Nitrosotalea sp.]
MRLLVTNDDGVSSPGLAALRSALAPLGEVLLVAPDAERSAIGHAITTSTPLRVSEYLDPQGGFIGYSVNGTPADCVKLALGSIHRSNPPDIVVSGINRGQNTGTSIIYSGTVSAATEARILGCPSIAVSLGSAQPKDWSVAAEVACSVARLVLARGLPERVLLNVNVPARPREEILGVRITRQGQSGFEEVFHIRADPRREPYYWLAGAFRVTDVEEDTDAWALEQGWISITPVSYDLTAKDALAGLEAWRSELWSGTSPQASVPKRRSPKSPRPGTM